MLIGLGIDYGIHFIAATRRSELVAGTPASLGTDVDGTQVRGIMTAALTMAAAFYTLLLTGFKGLSELGFITGSGLLLMFLATFMSLPALLVLDERRRGAPTHPPKRPREGTIAAMSNSCTAFPGPRSP